MKGEKEKDDRKRPPTPEAWEGGGRAGTSAGRELTSPSDQDREGPDPQTPEARSGDDNRRDVPGGSFRPSRTPGGTGPSTRDTDHAVEGDANESLIGRVRVAGEIQVHPTRAENDPDR